MSCGEICEQSNECSVFKSREIFNVVQLASDEDNFYCGLTYIADSSRYWYFLFNQEVTKDRVCVDQCIMKWQILKFPCHN